ncbi:hypothetical protein AACN07_004384 [Escherichia coli]|nr:hypothetical protein [Escherichia coli]EJH8601553.1 hypothetical protein [Escherichia coli]ELK4756931.1 hypothetical protein [Escherichia coli]
MLGGADNPNGELLSYIIGADMQDNIDCESGIIFDNDEDKTDSAALLPCIEQAREDVRTLRHLQLLHQNR